MLDQNILFDLFKYRDGKLYWKNAIRPSFNGKEAGYSNGEGYKKVNIKGKQLYVHRIIYMMHHGYCPKIVDHIDQNTSNNFVENLREATKSQNAINQTKDKKSSFGCRNVYYNKNRKKFYVFVKVNCKPKWFGSYEDIELAQLVAQEAREKYYGEFNNLENK